VGEPHIGTARSELEETRQERARSDSVIISSIARVADYRIGKAPSRVSTVSRSAL